MTFANVRQSRRFAESASNAVLVLVAFCLLFESPFALAGSTPPSRDNCSTPQRIGSVILEGDSYWWNLEATTGVEGQTNAACASPEGPGIENDFWYLWTANCNGHAEVATCGPTSTDTKIAAYLSSSCPTEPAIACNDDDCGVQSFISFEVHCCEEYLIQLGNKPGASPGNGQISIACVQDVEQPTCESTAGCCLPEGTCVDVDTACCASLDGIPNVMGIGCLGDLDNDGLDDSCGCNSHPACLACPGEICRPTAVTVSDVLGDFDIISCACASETNCFVSLLSGFPECEGSCESNLACRSTTIWDFWIEGTFSCDCESPCSTHADCSDMDICTCDQCYEGGCAYGPNVKFGDAATNGVVNLDDILCTLSGFANYSACPRGDWGPNCADDGVISIDDILASLVAFSGGNPCGCPNFYSPGCN